MKKELRPRLITLEQVKSVLSRSLCEKIILEERIGDTYRCLTANVDLASGKITYHSEVKYSDGSGHRAVYKKLSEALFTYNHLEVGVAEAVD